MINDTNITNSQTNYVKSKVELFNGSTLAETCTSDNTLLKLQVARTGAKGKFFGFGIGHKLDIELIDMYNSLNVDGADTIQISYSNDNSYYLYPYPNFYSIKSEKNEKDNTIKITAYDMLDSFNTYKVNELGIQTPYTVLDFVEKITTHYGLNNYKLIGINADSLYLRLSYGTGANLDGTESIRRVLDAIAEIMLAIYYIDNTGCLVFKRLDKDGAAALTLTKDDYYELTVGDALTVADLAHATELGENLITNSGNSGEVQYLRDNPFLEVMESSLVAEFLDAAIADIAGLTIYQYSADWIGSLLLEAGDKLALVRDDDTTVCTYLLNDTVTYDGTFNELTSWEYGDRDGESAANPTYLGEALNKTFAKVDKINQEITLVASQTDGNTEKLSTLEINTNSINTSVQLIQENLGNNLDTINADMRALRTEITQSAEDIKLDVITEIEQSGVDKVITTTGYTFDNEGLTIAKDDSDITTQITEDGMTVFNKNDAVLTADKEGVIAIDLHATTYLIIGENSRFEDYTKNSARRTGCFWIGG